jgi:hypothetical protein
VANSSLLVALFLATILEVSGDSGRILFVCIGNGLHLTPAAAFIGALSDTPLVIFAFNRWCDARCQTREARREELASEIIPPREQP